MSRTYFWIAVISTFSGILPFVVYWITRKSQESYMQNLAFILAAGLIADTIGMLNSFWWNVKNLSSGAEYAYMFILIIFLTLLYRSQFQKKYSGIFLVILISLLVTYIYILLFTGPDWISHDKKILIAATAIILSLAYFFRLMKETPSGPIQRLPMFWISSGYLIYFSGTMILFIMSDFIYKTQSTNLYNYWLLNWGLSILSNVLIAIGLWQVRGITRPA